VKSCKVCSKTKHTNYRIMSHNIKKFEAPNDHPIHKALIDGDAKAVDRYLKEGVDPYLNGVLAGGIHGGHLAVMDALLANGVDINMPVPGPGWRPLMRAVEARSMPVINYLLDKGADINGGIGQGATALHAAVEFFPSAIQLLLDHGAIVDARSENGRTPFREACRLNQIPSMEVLYNAGADIESACNEGATPFLSTVRSGAEEAMRWLIEHGADIHVRDKRNRSAVWWALDCNRPELAEFLRGFGIQG